jgi:hypothetical protein
MALKSRTEHVVFPTGPDDRAEGTERPAQSRARSAALKPRDPGFPD